MEKDEHGNPIEEAKGEDNTVAEADAFGEPNKPEPSVVEDKKEEGVDEIEKHPLVKELRGQIETVKKEYGGNLAGQREVIKRLESEIESIKKGGNPTGKDKEGEDTGEVLFKEIKWSKDLSEEERDEMTDNEIKQMDVIASMQEAQNKMYAEMQSKGKSEEDTGVKDINSFVRKEAMELSGDDTELTNLIIESFNSMKFSTEGLSEEELKKRVELSATQVPTYKAPKEQPTKTGKPVKKGGGDTDPFGID